MMALGIIELVIILVFLVWLFSRKSKTLLVGFLLVCFVGLFLYSVAGIRQSTVHVPQRYERVIVDVPRIPSMPELPHRVQVQPSRENKAAMRAQIEDLKAELRSAVAKEKALRAAQAAQKQIAVAQAAAEEESVPIDSEVSHNSELSSIVKKVINGDVKKSLYELRDYLNALEGMEVNFTIDGDAGESVEVAYQDDASEPPPLPMWVEKFVQADDYDYDGTVYQTLLLLGPYDSNSEMRGAQGENELGRSLRDAADQYQAWFCATEPDLDCRLTKQIAFEPSQRRLRKCIKEEFETTSPTDGRPMKYVLVEFDEKMESALRAHAMDCLSAKNSAVVGIYGAGFLAMLGTIFGYLKLDEVTKGNRRAMLRFGAMSVLGVLSLAYIVLAQYVVVGL